MAEIVDEPVTTDLIYDGWRKRLDAKDDWAKTDEDSPIAINVLANDVGALGIVKVNGKPIAADTPPVTLESGATVDLDGKTLIYDPGMAFQSLNSGENKSDTFSYTVAGYRGREDIANVAVTIEGVDEPDSNNAPVAVDDKAYLPDYYPLPLPYMPYANSVNINVLENDTDADGVATIAGTKVDTDLNTDLPDTVTLEDSTATVKLNADGSLTYTEGAKYLDTEQYINVDFDISIELVPTDLGGGVFPIEPPSPPVLVDSFTYTATDDGGAESNPATVEVYRMFDIDVFVVEDGFEDPLRFDTA
jgi:hypothetical protein